MKITARNGKWIVSHLGQILSTHSTSDAAYEAAGIKIEPDVEPIAATGDEDDYSALWDLMHTPAE